MSWQFHPGCLFPRIRHARVEEELQRELDAHLDFETRKNIEDGMAPREAARAARAALGNVPVIREDVRGIWRWRWLDQLVQDVQVGIRSLIRSPGFTAVSVSTLAVTIGATAAIFSVVYGILLRPLPVSEPARLVRIVGIGYVGELLELRKRARTLDVSAYGQPGDRTLTSLGEPVRLNVVPVAGDLLARLGCPPVLGSGFRLDDERPDAEPAAVLSHTLWRERFGADPAVIGRTLLLDGVAHTVRGVMPPDFRFPSAGADVWVPMTVDPTSPVGQWARSAFLVGRLRPHVSLETAAAEIRALGSQFGRLFPWRMPDGYGTRTSLQTWDEDRLRDVRSMLLSLLAAVGAMWLIGAVNLVNLQQVRLAARRQELALRRALGAGRGRVIRQLLTESSLLSLSGGILGSAIVYGSVPVLVGFLPPETPGIDRIHVNSVVLGFAVVLSLLTALAAGAVAGTGASPVRADRGPSGFPQSVGGAPNRIVNGFVTVEIAAAVALVIGATLLAKSLGAQLAVDIGFTPDRLVMAEVAPPRVSYSTASAKLDFYAALERRLHALPFVDGVGLSSVFEPFGAADAGRSVFIVDGRPNPATQGGEWPWTDLRTAVSTNYLSLLGIPVLEGRSFTEEDVTCARRVVLVSESLAKTWWPGMTAIGARIRFPGSDGETQPWRTVVGVVADVRWKGPTTEDTALYLPLAQSVSPIEQVALLLKSSADLSPIMEGLKAVVAGLDSETPVSSVRAVDEVLGQAVSGPRLTTRLVAAFATLGVVLGLIGVYGVIAYTAARQRHDIGIHLALGASRGNIQTRFVRPALVSAAVGIVIGETGAAVLMSSMSSRLFGVSPWDPVTYLATPTVFIVLAGLAAYFPARRATAVDPVTLVREE